MARRNTLAVLAVLATLGVGAALAQDADADKGRFVRWIESLISTPDRQISLNGFSGAFSSNPQAASIVIADERGPWLRLENVDLVWTRSALFRRRLDIQSLSAANVTWLRPAEKTVDAADEATDQGEFSLPVDIVIDRMSFPDIVVEEPALGAEANLALEGSVTLTSQMIAGDIALDRLDRPGTLAAKFRLDSDQNVLVADVNLTEPAGGIVAEGLDLTGRPALALSLSGEGPLDDWRGDLRVEAGGAPVLDGTIAVSRPAEAYTLNAELRGTLGDIAPAEYRALLAGESRVTIEAGRDATGAIDIAAASLRSEGAELTLSGRLAPDLVPQRAELAVQLGQAGRTAIPFAPAELSVATLSMTAGLDEGADAPWRAEIRATGLQSSAGAADRLDMTASGQANDLAVPEARALTFRMEGSVAGAAPADPALADALGRSLRLAGNGAWAGGAPVRFEALQLILDGAAVSFAGTADSGSLTGRYEVSATSLSRFALLLGRPLSGSAAISADGSIGLDRGTLDLTLAGSARDLRLGIPTVDPLLAGTTTLAGGLNRGADNGLRFTDLALANGETNTTITGLYSAPEIDLKVEALIADLAAVTPRASGRASLSGTILGTAAAPRLDLAASGSDIVLMQRPLTDATARFSGIVAGPETAGEATLSASLDGVPVEGSARLAAGAAGGRAIDDLALTVGRTRASGSLVLTGAGPVTGQIAIDSPDLSEVAPLFLVDASGALKADVTLSVKNGGQSAAVSGTGRSLVYGTYRAGLAEISGTGDDLLTAPKLDGRFSVRNVTAGGLTIIAADGTATRDGDATTIAADAELADGDVTLRAGLAPVPSGIDVALEAFRYRRRGVDVALAAPTNIAVRNGTARFNSAVLTTGGGRLTLDGSAGQTLALDLTLAGVPAALVNAFVANLDAEGAVSGTASVSGSASAPTARYDLAWSGASVAASRNAGLGALTVRANGTYGGDGVDVTSRIEGAGGLGVNVTGTVGTGPGGRLALNVTGAVPLALGNQQLASRGAVLQGALNVDIAVTGTASAPRYSGTVTASGGGFVDPDTGIVLSDLTLAAQVDNNRLVIQRLTARSGEGTVSAAGSIGLAGALPIDLTAQIRQARYVDGTLVAARFDADLTMSGSLSQGPILAGRVFIDRAEVTVPERLPASSVAVDVDHRATPPPVARTLRRAKYGTGRDSSGGGGGGQSRGITLDVRVDAPQQIFIRGRGLDAEVGGELRLRGPLSAVVTQGAFEMRRGRLDIFTQRVTFDRGSVTFAGDLDPLLDFQGTTVSKDITVIVTVSGRASDPAVEFSSVPELPEDEVLAHLLFNRGVGELSPIQIARLASAIAQMSGASSGGGILENLRKSTGLDDLDIVTDQEGEAALRAGRYVSENVYLGVEQGAAGSSKVTIDLDVTKDVKARGAFSSEGDSSIGIFYEREY